MCYWIGVQRGVAPLIQMGTWSLIIEEEMLRKQRIALLDRYDMEST